MNVNSVRARVSHTVLCIFRTIRQMARALCILGVGVATVMDCEYCGRKHRDEEGITRCREKAERASARQAKIDAEALRRQRIADKTPVPAAVRKLRATGGAGGTWERIVSTLNKDYPVRVGQPYTVWEAASLYAEQLNWPCPNEQATEMLLEKAFTGEYLTAHPLLLPRMENLYTEGVLSPEVLRRMVYPENYETEVGGEEDDL